MTVEELLAPLREMPVSQKEWGAAARARAGRIRRRRVGLAATGTVATLALVAIGALALAGPGERAAEIPSGRAPAPIIRSSAPSPVLPDIAFGPRVHVPGAGPNATAHLAHRGRQVELCEESVDQPGAGGCTGPLPTVAARTLRQRPPGYLSSAPSAQGPWTVHGPIVFTGYAGAGIARVTVADGAGHVRTADLTEIRARLGVGLYAAGFGSYAPPFVTTAYDAAGRVVGAPVRVASIHADGMARQPKPTITLTVAPGVAVGLAPAGGHTVSVDVEGPGGGGAGPRHLPAANDLGTDPPEVGESEQIVTGSKPARYTHLTTVDGLSGAGITRVVVTTDDGTTLTATPHSAAPAFPVGVYAVTIPHHVDRVTISGYDASGQERARWVVTTVPSFDPTASPSIP